MPRWLVIVLAAVAVLLGGAAVFVTFTIGWRNLVGMLRYDQRREGTLLVGQRAPDVTLVGLDGATPVRLAEHMREKPLVLVFGSFT